MLTRFVPTEELIERYGLARLDSLKSEGWFEHDAWVGITKDADTLVFGNGVHGEMIPRADIASAEIIAESETQIHGRSSGSGIGIALFGGVGIGMSGGSFAGTARPRPQLVGLRIMFRDPQRAPCRLIFYKYGDLGIVGDLFGLSDRMAREAADICAAYRAWIMPDARLGNVT